LRCATVAGVMCTMNRLAPIVIFTLGLVPLAGASEDHLIPEGSIFGDPFMHRYDLMVVEVLSKGFTGRTKLKMISIPSFRNEYAVTASESDGQYFVSLVTAKKHLWMYEFYDMTIDGQRVEIGEDGQEIVGPDKELEAEMASYPENYHDVGVDIETSEIDQATFEALLEVWRRMLVRARYPKLNPDEIMVRADGTNYYFSVSNPQMSGTTWSPSAGTSTGALVEISDLMADLAIAEKTKEQKEIIHAINKNIGSINTKLELTN
jgi:hypothetical protein